VIDPIGPRHIAAIVAAVRPGPRRVDCGDAAGALFAASTAVALCFASRWIAPPWDIRDDLAPEAVIVVRGASAFGRRPATDARGLR
jgi:hypothetical protein